MVRAAARPREFFYSYRNMLRRVERKSDGANIAGYRDDAYGRRELVGALKARLPRHKIRARRGRGGAATCQQVHQFGRDRGHLQWGRSRSSRFSILSDELLEEVKALPLKNFALEKLLNDEIKVRFKKNVVQAKSFAEMLTASVLKYQNRSLEAAEVITELIEIAKQVREASGRGDDLGLSDDEVAFYDALEVNDSAVKMLGEPMLKQVAHELITAVRHSVTIDWGVRESARARMRVLIKRILKKHGYPPDKQKTATETVLNQAEAIPGDIAA